MTPARNVIYNAAGLTTVLVTACMPGSAGPMMPQAAPGLSIVKQGSDTAVGWRDGSVAVSVTGRWASQGEQVLTVRYANTGRAAVNIAVGGFTLARGGDRAPLLHVDDFTGVDMTDADPANDQPTTLVSTDTPGRAVALHLGPGAARTLDVTFANLQAGGAVGEGQFLVARVPVVRKATVVTFETATEGWF